MERDYSIRRIARAVVKILALGYLFYCAWGVV
jgi:hypothetical protein